MAQIPVHPLKTRITVRENVSNHIRFVNIREIPIEIKNNAKYFHFLREGS